MLKMKRITETHSMKVFTDSGSYLGDVEDAVLTKTKVTAWRIKAAKSSDIIKLIGPEAKGVVVPQQLVRSIADVMIISKSAMPVPAEKAQPERN